jgi:signal transduction histidine kinase
MSVPVRAISDEYATALAHFLDADKEDNRQHAYELGRRAVAAGLGILDMAAIHHQALLAAAPKHGIDAHVTRCAEFFAECLTSFEMSLRGYRETNAELRRANAELETRNADISRVSRAKSDFLAMMSHELRTPLSSIIGFSEVLLDARLGELNERQKRYLGNVHGSSRFRSSTTRAPSSTRARGSGWRCRSSWSSSWTARSASRRRWGRARASTSTCRWRIAISR